MRNVTTLIVLAILFVASAVAQSGPVQPNAAQTLQPSQSVAPVLQPQKTMEAFRTATLAPTTEQRERTIPGGTPIEVEVAYTVNSLDLKPGERISFRVLVPILIGGVTIIEKGALVTALITQAKRGGHWGKAGKLVWNMEDVVGADNSRIPLVPETASRNDKLWSLETGRANSETVAGRGSVKGTSHTGEVAAMTIVSGAIFPPLALMNGFKRGENASLREGRRFVVAVGRDTTVKVVAAP